MVKIGLLVGIVNLIAGLILNSIFGAILPSLALEYQNPGMFRPWSDPLMLLFFASPFISGIALAYLWTLVRTKLKGSKAIDFAKIYFFVATIPGMFISYTTFQITFMMVLSWTVIGVIEAYVAGLLFTRFLRE